MSHYEERLNADHERILKQLNQLGDSVQDALRSAAQAVLTKDTDLATTTVLGDLRINRKYRALDHSCHVFVARHLPSAGHLRFVSAVMRLSKTLERIGDYAATISRATLQLTEAPPEQIRQDIEMMAQHAQKMLEQSLRAFREGNSELARGTLMVASQYGTTFDKVFSDLIAEGEERARPIAELFSHMAIFNRLERVIHQSKNICEQTLFVVLGETKHPKVFDVLFVDDHNTGASQLAEHFARKAYSEEGTFESAGWEAGEEIDAAYFGFAEERGLFLQGAHPQQLSSILHRLSDFFLVIDLTGAARQHLPNMPFHTTFLSWPLENRDDPEAVYRQLAPRINQLMSELRGEEEA